MAHQYICIQYTFFFPNSPRLSFNHHLIRVYCVCNYRWNAEGDTNLLFDIHLMWNLLGGITVDLKLKTTISFK